MFSVPSSEAESTAGVWCTHCSAYAAHLCDQSWMSWLKLGVVMVAEGGYQRGLRVQGTIKCSNLCTEILEYTSPEETAVCNLASIALPRFVRERGVASDRVKLTGSLNAPQR